MIISKNSQLGLNLSERTNLLFFVGLEESRLKYELAELQKTIEEVEDANKLNIELTQEYLIEKNLDEKKVRDVVRKAIPENWTDGVIVPNSNYNFIKDDGRMYLITNGVLEPSKRINTERFTGRALKDMKVGKHTYLLGADKFVRFECRNDAIKGVYFDKKNSILFEFGCDLDGGEYYFPRKHVNEFTFIMQIMTFIELGDIEVVILEGGKNNGKSKKTGEKVHNSTNYTVFVVDSSWNQLIIRTTGFAVIGHFRMQPCGPGGIDRKLIWIGAFEKNGYVRRPKAEIIQ